MFKVLFSGRAVFHVAAVFLSAMAAVSAVSGADDAGGGWYATVQKRYEEGLTHMREARAGDPELRLDRYTKALEAFEGAKSLLVERTGKDPALAERYRNVLTEINSCIFWASRFRPAPGSGKAPAGTGASAPATRPAPGPSPDAEAKSRLAEADDFAAKNPGETFRAAIRYFEVAERYRGTPAGIDAMARCIDRMQSFLDAHQFEGAAARLAPVAEPAGAPAAPSVDAAAVEGWIRKIRSECKDRAASEKKRDEAAAEIARMEKRLEEVVGLIKEIPRGTTGDQFAGWTRERDALRDRDIPKSREKLAKIEKKIAQSADEIAEAGLKLAQAGPGAIPLVEKWINDSGTTREAVEALDAARKALLAK